MVLYLNNQGSGGKGKGMSASSSEFSLPLEGKLAIVTGASRGIGEGIALELARRGASVALAYNSPSSEPQVRALAERIRALPRAAPTFTVQADLSTTEGPLHLIRNLQAQFRAAAHTGDGVVHPQKPFVIDVLVNNAGCERVVPLGQIDVADYNEVYDVNVRGVILLTQAALPYLRRTTTTEGGAARVINIGSVGARAGFKELSLYCSSKAALEGLTRCWAAELGGDGVTVNCVSPGPVESAMLDKIPTEIVDMQKKQTPVQNRLGTVDEVARVVAGLAGRDGDWISGQVISASGGWAMY
ncbi:SURF4-domain-containing protein [Apiospora arundinis]|uniref:3-ketoacyl-acyl carrier protein reductase n=1 Tax=Apiospora arundinis TaxID=335852 RepID=A0ABR2ITZ7_9PEZI